MQAEWLNDDDDGEEGKEADGKKKRPAIMTVSSTPAR